MFDTRETDRYRRELRAMVNAASQDDPEAFAQAVELLDWATRELLPEAAATLRAPDAKGRPGFSWADLGRALGVTRSAAAQRFGRKTVA